MSEPRDLAPLMRVLEDLLDWLKASEVRGMVLGGVAASLLGRPRLTKDVDVLVLLDEGRWADFLAAGDKHGFVPRRGDSLDFARETRVLLGRHKTSGIDADIVFEQIPEEYFAPEDLAEIEESFDQIRHGEYVTLEKMEKELGLNPLNPRLSRQMETDPNRRYSRVGGPHRLSSRRAEGHRSFHYPAPEPGLQ